MDKFKSAAQQYLIDKGVKSNEDKFTALEVEKMLNEFALEQTVIDEDGLRLKKTPDEVFKLIDNGYERYHTDPLIRVAVDHICVGNIPEKIIDNLVAIINDQSDELIKYAEGRIGIHQILNNAEVIGAKYSVQYQDYSPENWTVAVKMLKHRKLDIISDKSVKKVRIEYEM